VFNEHFLNTEQRLWAENFVLNELMLPENDEKLKHVRAWMLMKLSGRYRPEDYDPRQKGCPDLIPGLTAQPVWDANKYDWLVKL
jgi:hypothetical protein